MVSSIYKAIFSASSSETGLKLIWLLKFVINVLVRSNRGSENPKSAISGFRDEDSRKNLFAIIQWHVMSAEGFCCPRRYLEHLLSQELVK